MGIMTSTMSPNGMKAAFRISSVISSARPPGNHPFMHSINKIFPEEEHTIITTVGGQSEITNINDAVSVVSVEDGH